MPFVTRPPAAQSTAISPRARIRIPPEPNADTGETRQFGGVGTQPPSAPVPPKKAAPGKHQPTGDYPEGYCRPPVGTRFQIGNPGGPGRPKKDSKSQDQLMRAELLKSQHVTEGGRRRRRTMRELVPGLLIKATLQKLSPKELRALQEEARRLFPERADPNSVPTFDPRADLQYVRDMISAIQIGEISDEGADPLADFATSVFDANDREGDDNSWDEGDWDAGHEERTDEEA